MDNLVDLFENINLECTKDLDEDVKDLVYKAVGSIIEYYYD